MMQKTQVHPDSKGKAAAKTILQGMPLHAHVDDGLEDRFCHAWEVAFKDARVLKSRGAEKIFVFGSLLSRERFHAESDIDLAVNNFTMADSFDAAPSLDWDISIDVVPLQSVYPEKREYILSRSVQLDA